MNGKLISIDGVDGCGKATQSEILKDRLINEGFVVKKIEFPNYKSDSSALIKMYLNGEFGDKANSVNPFVASTFYAADRFASFKKDWEHFLMDGGIVICDRYTTSNMIHQAAKIDNEERKIKYLDWLWDFEFNLFNLPQPDSIIFLDIPIEYSIKFMADRDNKFTGEKTKDIHEKDFEYLKKSYYNALFVARRYSWNKINCIKGNKLKTIEEIHEEIYKTVKCVL
jgi:dTMP kinase